MPVHVSTRLSVSTNGIEYTFSVVAVSAAGDGAAVATLPTATPVPTITLTLDGTELTEGDTDSPITATVSVSNPSFVAVEVAVAEVIPTGGAARVTIAGAPVTIPVGRTTPTPGGTPVTITAVDNALDDGGAAARVVATSANATTSDTADVTIADDDEAPSAPRSLTLTAGDASITAEWITPASAGTDAGGITSYQYRTYATATGAPAADAATQGWTTATSGVSITTVTTDDTTPTLTNGTEYTVEVRAVSAAGSGESASETANPPPRLANNLKPGLAPSSSTAPARFAGRGLAVPPRDNPGNRGNPSGFRQYLFSKPALRNRTEEMHGIEKRIEMRRYIEAGVSKAATARAVGISRRTLYNWIKAGELKRDPDDMRVEYGPQGAEAVDARSLEAHDRSQAERVPAAGRGQAVQRDPGGRLSRRLRPGQAVCEQGPQGDPERGDAWLRR